MNKRITTFPGASIERSSKRDFLSFRLQSNGLFTISEYNYSQGYHKSSEGYFEAVNVSVVDCIKIADIFGANFNNLQERLYELQGRIEEFQNKQFKAPEVERTDQGIKLSGHAAEYFLMRKEEMETKRKKLVVDKMFDNFLKDGYCNVIGNDIAGFLAEMIEANKIEYHIFPMMDYNRFVRI
ncbi:hypothetical protein CPT_Stills59 [Bacillus phage Stills]|uniref:Uncharacterized protein n=1 Tax=Bacillus phage Stills TaxID=1610833 RepID=A0A0E3XA55_9CAUD|nr:hypothetical protein CPT_Stills59 [Bacillus phage Stills]AKC02687.1 hypothetical protein CPT_Stills59 [Bacillus phage Stills]